MRDDYFVKRTDERLQRVEEKLDELLRFKWQILGGSMILSAGLTLLVSIVMSFFGHGS